MSLENTKSLIRSCVVSSRKRLTVEQLEKDYEYLVGLPIPYQEHGFPNTEALFRSIPGVVQLTTVGNKTRVEYVPTESVAHIASLVTRQRGK